MSAIHQTIKNQIKEALRAKDTIRLETLRGLSALFQNELLTSKEPTKNEYLDDGRALALIKRSVKQRKDSIDQFSKGNRHDLVVKEKTELTILESFLPAMMSREEIKIVVKTRLDALKAQGIFDPKAGGKITGMIMKELSGKADGADVKAIVDEMMKE